MWEEVASRLRGMPRESLKQNGRHFLRNSMETLFLTCGEVHVADPGSPERGWRDEPRHRDGAGSAIHLSLTLFGRRDVRCETETRQRQQEAEAGDLLEESTDEEADDHRASAGGAVSAAAAPGSPRRRAVRQKSAAQAVSAVAPRPGETPAAQAAAGPALRRTPEAVIPCGPGTVYLGQAGRRCERALSTVPYILLGGLQRPWAV